MHKTSIARIRPGTSPVRAAYRIAFSQWRRARRNLLKDGAIETYNEAVHMMRVLSRNWHLPEPAVSQGKLVRGVFQWAGPYHSGRAVLRKGH